MMRLSMYAAMGLLVGAVVVALSAPSLQQIGAAPGSLGDNGAGRAVLPDPALTPGATLPVDASDICVAGYSKKVRNVPAAVKRQVYAEYNVTPRPGEHFEVDHLISLELGGSNSVKNLWPEPYEGTDNAHIKDKLENVLHGDVCTNRLPLAQAQQAIATNWIAAYHQYVEDN